VTKGGPCSRSGPSTVTLFDEFRAVRTPEFWSDLLAVGARREEGKRDPPAAAVEREVQGWALRRGAGVIVADYEDRAVKTIS
jgi:hypothetical protein